MAAYDKKSAQILERRNELREQVGELKKQQQQMGLIMSLIWNIRIMLEQRRLDRVEVQADLYKLQKERELLQQVPVQTEKTEDVPQTFKEMVRSSMLAGLKNEEAVITQESMKRIEKEVETFIQDIPEAFSLKEGASMLLMPACQSYSETLETLKERAAEEILPEQLQKVHPEELAGLIQENNQKKLIEILASEYANDLPFEQCRLEDRKALAEISPQFASRFRDDPSLSDADLSKTAMEHTQGMEMGQKLDDKLR